MMTIFLTSKLEEFVDDKLDVYQITRLAFDREGNILEKGENTGYQHFFLFPKYFLKPCF